MKDPKAQRGWQLLRGRRNQVFAYWLVYPEDWGMVLGRTLVRGKTLHLLEWKTAMPMEYRHMSVPNGRF